METRNINPLLSIQNQSYPSASTQAAEQDFIAAAKNAYDNAASTAMEGTAGVTTQGMSLQDYKNYVYEQISNLPVHPSQYQWEHFVNISDEGFMAMMKDPEYEQFVLNTLQDYFSLYDPRCSETLVIFDFGATKEECQIVSHTKPTKAELELERKAYYARKRARKKEQEEALEIYYEKKRLMKKFYAKQDLEKSIDKRMRQRAEALGKDFIMPVRTTAPPAYIPVRQRNAARAYFDSQITSSIL